MHLDTWEIGLNQDRLDSNRRAVAGLVGNKTDKPLLLTEIVRLWNPGFLLGCDVNTKVRPVKGSLFIDGNGGYVFEARGDDKVDFSPESGLVDIGVYVSFNPSGRCFSFGRSWNHATNYDKPEDKTDSPIDQLKKKYNNKLMNSFDDIRFNAFLLYLMPDFDNLRDKKKIDFNTLNDKYINLFENYDAADVFLKDMKKNNMVFGTALEKYVESSAFIELCRKASTEQKNTFDEIIDSGVTMSVLGAYSSYSRPNHTESLANAMSSTFGRSNPHSNGNIIHAIQLGIDFKLDDRLAKLEQAKYKLEPTGQKTQVM